MPNIGFFPKKLKPTSENATMASALFLSVLIFFAPMVLSQDPSTAAPPCASRLLALAPCGPFVQGLTQLPAQPCCDSLGQIYVQEPTCLCLFLNNTYAFPIDKTLALQLPRLCNIPANASTCSGVSAAQDSPVTPPLNAAVSPISLGAKNNSPVAAKTAATPAVQAAPRPTSIVGLGLGLRSSAPKSEIQLPVFAIAAFLPGILLL